jgi:transposase-like protein
MPFLSNLPQLFDTQTCQAYIHHLRWKDRFLQCPRCQSHNVGPWGTYHYQPGLKRYRCKEQDCKRTFNDLTGTLLDGSKRSLAHWILATFLLCLACSSRRIARELGMHIRTSYRWCWWLRNAAVSYEMGRQVEGTVEADDLYHTAGNKGQAQGGGTKVLGRRARGRRKKREPGRGHYDKDRPAIIAWISRQGAVVIQATKDFTVQTVQKAANVAVHAGSRLYTDSASSYRAVTGYVHEFVNHTKKEDVRQPPPEQLQPCRLPVPSHPSCPCAAVRAGGLPAASSAGQPLARGVRADPRRGHQRAGWQQGGMGWADAVGGKGRLIFLSPHTSATRRQTRLASGGSRAPRAGSPHPPEHTGARARGVQHSHRWAGHTPRRTGYGRAARASGSGQAGATAYMETILSAPSAGSNILTFERLLYEIPRCLPARYPALCCFLSRGTVRASPRSNTAVSQALAGDRHYAEIRPPVSGACHTGSAG